MFSLVFCFLLELLSGAFADVTAARLDVVDPFEYFKSYHGARIEITFEAANKIVFLYADHVERVSE